MDFTLIKIKADGGPVSINIGIPKTPQLTGGKVFRFNPTKPGWDQVGIYHNDHPQLQLGLPGDVNDINFFVSGLVVSLNDTTESTFQVIIEISQDGESIAKTTPADGGSGIIKDEDKVYSFGFKLTTA